MTGGHADPLILRILDANLNRVREGLRVLEEHARFVLEDAALSRACKEARHEVRELTAMLPSDLVRTRDIVGDVGAGINTPTEAARADASDVATAAAKRTQEALRVIEEYAKVVSAGAASRVERLRYLVYELELRVHRHAVARERLGEARVYVILTEALCRKGWLETAEAVLSAGAEMLQLREKTLPDRELLDRAKRLADLCRGRGRIFIVNDRPDIARLAGADGVHVGRSDLPAPQVRRILGPRGLVGVSTHNTRELEASLSEGPDYVAVGPMFPSSTKLLGAPAGLEALREARNVTSLPRVAIGGIRPDNAARVCEADPEAILCVCSAVISEPSPGSVVETLLRVVQRGGADEKRTGATNAAREGGSVRSRNCD